jgi:CSLREA domain-containing protein
VTKTANSLDGACDGDCSLREAIAAANAQAGDDVIEFDATVFAGTQTITLGGTELLIESNGGLTINGTGAAFDFRRQCIARVWCQNGSESDAQQLDRQRW